MHLENVTVSKYWTAKQAVREFFFAGATNAHLGHAIKRARLVRGSCDFRAQFARRLYLESN